MLLVRFNYFTSFLDSHYYLNANVDSNKGLPQRGPSDARSSRYSAKGQLHLPTHYDDVGDIAEDDGTTEMLSFSTEHRATLAGGASHRGSNNRWRADAAAERDSDSDEPDVQPMRGSASSGASDDALELLDLPGPLTEAEVNGAKSRHKEREKLRGRDPSSFRKVTT